MWLPGKTHSDSGDILMAASRPTALTKLLLQVTFEVNQTQAKANPAPTVNVSYHCYDQMFLVNLAVKKVYSPHSSP